MRHAQSARRNICQATLLSSERWRSLMLAAALLLCCHGYRTPEAKGADLTFAPGDACFPFWLYEETLTKLEQGPHVVPFRFAPHFNAEFRPSTGYELCRLDLTPELRKSLRVVYDRIRAEYYSKVVVVTRDDAGVEKIDKDREINPMYAFVYSKGHVLQNLRVGWRYNENWPALVHAVDPWIAATCRYSTYASSFDELAMEWRDSALHPGLHVDQKVIHRWSTKTPHFTIQPVGPIKIVVVPQEALQNVFERSEVGAYMAVADSKATFYEWSVESNTWLEKDLKSR